MLRIYSHFILNTLILLCSFSVANALIIEDASALVIEDTYWGSEDHGYGDRIGNSRYEVYSMNVNVTGSYLNVRVNTNFNAAVDPYGIDFGDLFISTNGWNPYGSAPYTGDNALTGEAWEFVFDTSKKTLYGGEFTILNSNDLLDASRYIFRNGQEVQRGTGGTALSGSSVELSNAGYGGYVEYNILLSSLGAINGDIGLKWGMTCANDTIEGVYHHESVPEPGTFLLFGVGLLGMLRIAQKP